MRRSLLCCALLVLAVMAALSGKPAQAAGEIMQVTGVPKSDRLNLRSGPSTQYRVIGALRNGDQVRVLGCEPSGGATWCHVEQQTEQRGRGWANARYLLRVPGVVSAPRPKANRPNPPRNERIRFYNGRGSAEVQGTLPPGGSVRYVFEARKRQSLRLRLNPQHPRTDLKLLNASGKALYNTAKGGNKHRMTLERTGDYGILIENRGNNSGRYALRLELD